MIQLLIILINMPNNRQKGKRYERELCHALKGIFPDIRRNANEQSQMGGVDVLNTDIFDFEVKGGKAYKSRMVREALNQVADEGSPSNFKCVYFHPQNEEPYVAIPFEDFLTILELMKNEQIIKSRIKL